MAEANQLLPGFNHNVKHQGKLYHVQTEDSGTANPHVITCLFLGGNVLASKKTSYADAIGAADLAARVRALMEAQHKDMLRQLVRGAFQEEETRRTGAARAFAPGELAAGAEAAPEPPAPPSPRAARGEPPVLARIARVSRAGAPRPEPDAAPPALAAAAPAAAERAAAPEPAAAEPPDPRLDELVLSYLAGDLELVRGGA
jgi:hypothetical protein